MPKAMRKFAVVQGGQHTATGGRRLIEHCSLEATLPGAREIAELAEIQPAGTEVYLSALPHAHYERQLAAARAVRMAGLEPVPHLAARHFRDEDDLSGYLSAMTGEAGVERVLVVGGDVEVPRGPYTSSLDVLRSEAFLNAGIRSVGIAGYPEGHPVIEPDMLLKALRAKLAWAHGAGLDVHIVSQFAFAAQPVLDWLDWLAEQGLDVPVKVGLAGPASAKTLLKFALRCGVDLPVRKANSAAKLLWGVTPDTIIRALEAGGAQARYPGAVALHFYTFGGLVRSAKWIGEAKAAAAGPSC